MSAPARHAVWIAIAAVGVELSVSANLLTWLGLPYVAEGGSLALKLHPGTLLLLSSAALLCLHGAGWRALAADGPLLGFMGGLAACILYLLAMTGPGHLVVLLDTFLPAGLLAMVLGQTSPKQLAILRRAMQCLFTAGAALALVETAMHATLIPLYLNDAAYHPHTEDFRATALYDHPLTGAVMMMLGLALSPAKGYIIPTAQRSDSSLRAQRSNPEQPASMRVVTLGCFTASAVRNDDTNVRGSRLWAVVVRWAYCALLSAALLSFGGRMSVAVMLLLAGAGWAVPTARLILSRDARGIGRLFTAAVIVLGALPLVTGALAAGLGTRIAGHLYWDDSAQVRLAQWQILAQLDAWQLMFGTRRPDLLALLTPLWLGYGVEVIENFWLLMFVAFGGVGFSLFVGSLLSLLIWCWRRSALHGRLLIIGVLLVASTSNSLGRKSTILVCLVATVACRAVETRRAEASPAMLTLSRPRPAVRAAAA